MTTSGRRVSNPIAAITKPESTAPAKPTASSREFVVLLTKFATHRIARAVAEEEAERLHHGHDGERDADSTGLRGAELADEKGVSQVVCSSHQIGNDGRQA